MISYSEGDAGFNYRAAAAIIHDGHVLLVRDERDDFWYMPRGRCELLESSDQTLRREVWEELGVEVRVGRLLWVVENFFEHDNRRNHELGFYYLVALPEGSPYLDKGGEHRRTEENGATLTFRWFPLARLSEVRLFPSFLRRALRAPPTETQHIVHRDADE